MKAKLLLLSFLFASPLIANAMSFPNREPRITLDGKLNCPTMPTSGGTAYLQIFINTSRVELQERERRPMNISVVLDRSGSMSDERKMDYAKSAVSTLIDQLQTEDIFSLVVYDDVVDVVRSASKVGNKQNLKRLLSDIYPRNSTNLGGGMMEGLRQVERNIGREYVNRVILLSDGLANQGVTDPHELNRIAKRYRAKSISVTTMGVGLDYNENLMVGLVESGGGNYYFIENPGQLASIMRKECNTLSSVLAQNVSLNVRLGRGVKMLDVIGCEHAYAGDEYAIPIGDLYANETREYTIELSIPEGTGTSVVATGTLEYESMYARFERRPSFTATVRYSRDVASIERSRDLDVQAKADIAISTRRVDRAMTALDEGREEEAKGELSSARQALMSSPAASGNGVASAAIQEQAAKLESFNQTLDDKDTDARKAKKAIQYENYRVQKKK